MSLTNQSFSDRIATWAGSLFRGSIDEPVSIVTMGLGDRGRVGMVSNLSLSTLDDTQIHKEMKRITYQLRNPGLNLNSYVYSGRGGYRRRHSYILNKKGAHGAVWLVDAANKDAMAESADHLKLMMEQDFMKNVPLVVFARNSHQENALSVGEISKMMDLDSFKNQWRIQASDVPNQEESYSAALHWLAATAAGQQVTMALGMGVSEANAIAVSN
eukprot:TRINITY_DN1239_c0_g1_i1.p1 TRINITY_DN1239_c0_g1~~TRINITY_DN1239_c0_g1_i1.p1  ORF type:complete len:234 (+),score=54.17 TRINITY_DN1239_c0_g1_i1:60-704(+)